MSLVSIRDVFHDFELRHWVVTLYLLTYAGFPVIFVQLSDILGRKLFIPSTLAVVAMFSIAVNGLSHFNAGVHLLPLLLSSPAPTSHGGIRTSRYEVGRPAFLLVVTWGRYADAERCLRLLCACSAAPGELRRLLGFPSLQVTMGFGLGMILAILPIYVPFLVDRADLVL
ncbi:hypothetical protein QIS74_04564 [Colletotrichum tabaci]|uniref:Major facilitator superfamily (MFS) profile domain-containing protein n=1 Tax=Colletotrichum tabaci TaxID=1209068 RepID=A0AAV9THX5_9PEZI